MLVLGDSVGNNLSGTSSTDTVQGFAGDDTISGGAGNDLLLGNQDNDQITAEDGFNTVYGGVGNDLITAGNGSNLLFGDEGSDTIRAGNGGNIILGGTGREATDSLDGADFITSGSGNDFILGNGGNDTVGAGAGNDVVAGGYSDDILLGQLGNDLLLGNQGNDTLYGGAGDDTLYGGQNDDLLYGNEGNDLIIGGEGNDTATFSGSRSSYLVTLNQDGTYNVANGTSIDTVSGVETFRFDDDNGDPNKFLTDTSQGGPGPTPVQRKAEDDPNEYLYQPLEIQPLVEFNLLVKKNSYTYVGDNILDNDDERDTKDLSVKDIFSFTFTGEDTDESATGVHRAGGTTFTSKSRGSSAFIGDNGSVSFTTTPSDNIYGFNFQYDNTDGSSISTKASVNAFLGA